jgi:hypothetical protein
MYHGMKSGLNVSENFLKVKGIGPNGHMGGLGNCCGRCTRRRTLTRVTRSVVGSRMAPVLTLAAICLACSLNACGGTARGTAQQLGDTTSEAAVVEALEATGYRLLYRKVPQLEGYDVISGEAINSKGRIQFTVEINLAGPFGNDVGGAIPQPPVLRYGPHEEGTVVGNVIYKTAYNGSSRPGRGGELEASRNENAMAVHVGVALRELFAPRFRPVG